MRSLEKERDKEQEAWRWTSRAVDGCPLPLTCHHHSNSPVRCQVWPLHTHTHTHTLSRISHPSQLGVQDTRRVNLIREKIRPWQNECLLLYPWSARTFKVKLNRCCTVAAHYLQYNINCKITPWNTVENQSADFETQTLSHLRNET